ncbi:MAG: hypothetical protein ACHQFW_03475 [Chitinophagales bacterium]
MTIIEDPDKPVQVSPPQRPQKRYYLTGLALVGAGILYFLDRSTTIELPVRFISWELILILVGIFIGEKSSFKGFSWLICIGLGLYFMLDEFYPHFDLHVYFGPAALILLGAWFIFGPRSRSGRRRSRYNQTSYERGFASDNGSADDYVDVVSVFGGVNKNVITKQFKGGEATSIFGGTELNLMQADFEGKVILELTQIFGGCTLVIPPHWDLKTELVNVFGGVEDQRPTQNATVDTRKVILLRGTSIFGGIEIRSY